MTLEEKTTRAEIKILLKSIQKNVSFAAYECDNELFKDCFSDSLIAQNYQMGRTKAAYVTLHGLAPHVLGQIRKDMQGSPFRYQFDESTNVQVKKQYDAYIYYFSEAIWEVCKSLHRNIVCGTLLCKRFKSSFLFI